MKKISLLVFALMFSLVFLVNVNAEGGKVAKIGDTEFATIEEAVETAKEGETIVLLDDVDLSSKYTESNSYIAQFADGVVFDMDGHTIITSKLGFRFEGNNLVIKNGTFESVASYSLWIGTGTKTSGIVIENVSTVGGINIFNTTDCILRNMGNVVGHTYYAVWTDLYANAIIEDGNYTTDGNYGLLGGYDSSIVIKGGKYITNNGKLMTSSSVDPVIIAGTFNTNVEEYVDEESNISENDGEFVVSKNTYKVNIVASEGGVVTADKVVASKGDTVGFSIKANEGYRIEQVLIVDTNDDAVSYGEDSFVMPKGDVTLKVVFEKVITDSDVPVVNPDEKVEKPTVGITDSDKINDILINSYKSSDNFANISEDTDVIVSLEVEELDEDNISEEVKKNIEKKAENLKVVSYFDISVAVKEYESQRLLGNLSELTEEVEFVMVLPEVLKNTKKDVVRKFYVIRRHIDKDGAEVYDKIPADLSEDGTHLTFKTSKFSTYALAYSDSTVSNIVDNPQTYDGGLNSIIMAIISVMILASASVYLVKSKA